MLLFPDPLSHVLRIKRRKIKMCFRPPVCCTRDRMLSQLMDRPLVRQFDGCFARASPAWLDTSTGQECAELEEAAGGAMALSALTGSRAYERFSVHLIRQTFGRLGVSWSDCSHIALASSFGASLPAGKRVCRRSEL